MSLKHTVMRGLRPFVNPITRSVLKRHYKANLAFTEQGKFTTIVVLAPHMDDETIGLGGTIRRHADQGCVVHCVFSTDGSNSRSNLSKQELSRQRKAEIKQVQSILGINHVHYLDYPDGSVSNDEASQEKLRQILLTVKPDLIYCPPLVDAHPDHIATTAILASVLESMGESDILIRMYEINCPIPPQEINCIVDISSIMEVKQSAIDAFESQTIAFDGFLELNKQKKHLVAAPNVTAVEVFLELQVEQFISQVKCISGKVANFPTAFKQVNRTETLLWAIYKNLKLKKQLYQDCKLLNEPS